MEDGNIVTARLKQIHEMHEQHLSARILKIQQESPLYPWQTKVNETITHNQKNFDELVKYNAAFDTKDKESLARNLLILDTLGGKTDNVITPDSINPIPYTWVLSVAVLCGISGIAFAAAGAPDYTDFVYTGLALLAVGLALACWYWYTNFPHRSPFSWDKFCLINLQDISHYYVVFYEKKTYNLITILKYNYNPWNVTKVPGEYKFNDQKDIVSNDSSSTIAGETPGETNAVMTPHPAPENKNNEGMLGDTKVDGIPFAAPLDENDEEIPLSLSGDGQNEMQLYPVQRKTFAKAPPLSNWRYRNPKISFDIQGKVKSWRRENPSFQGTFDEAVDHWMDMNRNEYYNGYEEYYSNLDKKHARRADPQMVSQVVTMPVSQIVPQDDRQDVPEADSHDDQQDDQHNVSRKRYQDFGFEQPIRDPVHYDEEPTVPQSYPNDNEYHRSDFHEESSRPARDPPHVYENYVTPNYGSD
jgi:hypothetical protein